VKLADRMRYMGQSYSQVPNKRGGPNKQGVKKIPKCHIRGSQNKQGVDIWEMALNDCKIKILKYDYKIE